jgi:dipeptidyl aminopeptidase/acylaminoacyl peptidase
MRFTPLLLSMLLGLAVYVQAESPGATTSQPPEWITRHTYEHPTPDKVTEYLLYHPSANTPPTKRSLLIFLYGAGGSIDLYNIKRPPYALLREQLATRGYYIVVPDLGKFHFMNDAAKKSLDGVVAQILTQQEIPEERVHVMGTSMGAGSSLAYAIHRPDLIQSVCAVMPMTDFATWVVENPGYVDRVAKAYGGTYEQAPEAYDRNSALKNGDAFANIPVMLIHGNADKIVIYEQSQRLATLLQDKSYACDFVTADKQGHKDEVMRAFQPRAVEFLEAAVK